MQSAEDAVTLMGLVKDGGPSVAIIVVVGGFLWYLYKLGGRNSEERDDAFRRVEILGKACHDQQRNSQESHERHVAGIIERSSAALDRNTEALGKIVEGQTKILAEFQAGRG